MSAFSDGNTRRTLRAVVWFALGASASLGMLRLVSLAPNGTSKTESKPFAPAARQAAQPLAPTVAPGVPGVVLARFKDGGMDRARVLNDLDTAVSESINPDTHDVTLRFLPQIPVEGAIAALQSDPEVVFAEPDYLYSTDYTPNDPYFDRDYDSSDGPLSQWYLKTIHAPQAWDDLRVVKSKIRLAILDTGIDTNHPDLKRLMARDSKGEVVGRSFVAGESSPTDGHGHGTHCAGIAQADTDNGVGVAGVGFRSFELVPVKVLSEQGFGQTEWIANGITWAADNGCRVESMSLGGGAFSQAMQDAINYAWSKGVIVVAAAGNSATSVPHYPAGNNHVVAVSATDPNDRLASFSNFGAPIAVGAPGVKLLSTLPTYPCAITRGGRRKNNYDSLSGTSMACPVVSGMMAALLAYQPSLKPEQAIQRIEQTADNLAKTPDGGWDLQFGNGRVNLENAISNRPRKAGVGSFYGQVTDRNDKALPGATVRCGETQITTGPDGVFRLANLKVGNYTLAAAASGMKGTLKAAIVPGADANLVIPVGGG